MPYVTHKLAHTYVNQDSRLTPREAIRLQLNPEEQVNYSMHSRNFFNVRTFFTENPRPMNIGGLLDCIDREFTKEYITFRIPKASGGTRTIEAPTDNLKNLQRSIADQLLHYLSILPHNSAYAYTSGRSAYDALVTHQRRNARWFLKLDIKDFFPSITKRVLLNKLPEVYPLQQMARAQLERLTDIATNPQNALPQGSPLSPILSNLVMVGFDLNLTLALKSFNRQTYTYTRYADDLLISCPYSFKFEDVVQLVERHFTEAGLPFRINRDKLRYASKAGRNWNLGLMYTQDQAITVGTKRKRELHSLVNSFICDAYNQEHWDISATQELVGKLGYLKNVEPSYYDAIINKYNTKYNADFHTTVKYILRGGNNEA